MPKPKRRHHARAGQKYRLEIFHLNICQNRGQRTAHGYTECLFIKFITKSKIVVIDRQLNQLNENINRYISLKETPLGSFELKNLKHLVKAHL